MSFSQVDKKIFDSIKKARDNNFLVFSRVATYLNEFPCLITEDAIKEITGGVVENEQMAFYIFLSGALSENDTLSRLFEREYFNRGVRKLDPREYLENPYFKNIKIPNKQAGTWTLGYQAYKAYEGFIWKDIEVLDDYKEVPQIGFFDREFSFPTVFENGVEWMAIKPNEIETMKHHIQKMRGRVAVFGLGIGYFAYMVSEKSDVEEIVIIERDENVIKLFNEYILPQFSNKDKIKIVKADAFDYAENKMPDEQFDKAFVDLWHDTSDGVDLYMKIKKLECKSPKTEFCYWIEKSILSSIRWRIFEAIENQVEREKFTGTISDIKTYLSENYLKNFVKFI